MGSQHLRACHPHLQDISLNLQHTFSNVMDDTPQQHKRYQNWGFVIDLENFRQIGKHIILIINQMFSRKIVLHMEYTAAFTLWCISHKARNLPQ